MGLPNNRKPKNRLLVPWTIDNPSEGFPVHGIYDANLGLAKPFDGFENFVENVCEKHKSRDKFIYVDHCNAGKSAQGLKEDQMETIIDSQGSRSELDKITIPYFDKEYIEKEDYSDLDDYRSEALEYARTNYADAEIVLAKYRSDEDPSVDDYEHKPDYVCLHFGARITPYSRESFENIVSSFVEDAELPVIGYGIPEYVSLSDPRYFASSWISDQDFYWFMLGDTPVRGGSSSESRPFVKPEDSGFVQIVDLRKVDFDPNKPLSQLEFEYFHPDLADKKPKEIISDDDLQGKHRDYIRGSGD